MADAYTLVTNPAVPMTVVGLPNQIVLNRREVRMAAFGMETEEIWLASTIADAKAYQVTLLADERVADLKISQDAGEDIKITVLWCYDRNNSAWTVGADTPLWLIDIVETSQPLENHPYFLRRSAGTLLTAIMPYFSQADQYRAIGVQSGFALPTDSAQKEIIGRYLGLTSSGVGEYAPPIVCLTKRFRLFTSQPWTTLFQKMNRTQSIDQVAPPEEILTAIDGLETPTYDDTGSITPTFLSTGFLFGWIAQKPEVRLSGNNPKGPRDVTLRWFGMQQASELLFPADTGNTSSVLWDPIITALP